MALSDPARLDEAARHLEARLGVTVGRSAEGGRLSAMTASAADAHEAIGALIAAGMEPADFSMGSPSLDEVFFALTAHHLAV